MVVAAGECGWHARKERPAVAADAADWAQAPFPPLSWVPVQMTEHDGYSPDEKYFVGTYVDSLSVNFQFPGVDEKPLPLESRFEAPGAPPSWFVLGDGLIMCKGVAVGFFPREPDSSGRCRNLRIARLPRSARPSRSLQFPGILREVHATQGGRVACSSHLLTLVVTPEGWILGLAAHASAPTRCDAGMPALGCSRDGATGAIDLSAIRFSIRGGISLIDSVTLQECNVAGTRLIILQGHLSERCFRTDRAKPLSLLPESCRPPRNLNFVVSGSRAGSFNLLAVQPAKSFDAGCGAELLWRDSVWIKDDIHLSGIIYEVEPRALGHSLIDMKWSTKSGKIFLKEFQTLLTRKFGSVAEAWSKAFDTDQSGSINFTEFGLGCKAAGYVGNVMKLWAALDVDHSGDISLEELDEYIELDTVNSLDIRRYTAPASAIPGSSKHTPLPTPRTCASPDQPSSPSASARVPNLNQQRLPPLSA